MLIRQAPDVRSSEITPEPVYRSRREFIRAASGAAAGALAFGPAAGRARAQEPIPDLRKSPLSTDERLNSFEDITTYNNFYEFGLDKGDPARYAHEMTTEPWSVRVEGEMNRPDGDVPLETLLAPHAFEERIYRLRCVEAWSMVVPWVGFPLGDLIKRFEPTSRARYIRFETLHRPSEMRELRRRFQRVGFDWPYVEGLRMDEAMHPLTILAVGVYGKTLLNQQGAPLRLVVPWKYGFKSIKSIVRIQFVEEQPRNSWNVAIPNEYGFYSNVNPEVDHPRWSQASERRIGEFFRMPTRMFNGYADQVAGLYEGMDLRRHY